MTTTVSRLAAIVFGTIMLVLSVLIAVETIVRKVLGVSLGGVDELSGYAVAVGAPLAFTVALIEQSHIRINIVHMLMPHRIQAVLNLLAALTLAALAIFLFAFTVWTVQETQLFGARAQTPWATPLIYPQIAWLVAMAIFATASAIMAARAVLLLFKFDWRSLRREFAPETVEEELQAELGDLARR